MGSKIKLAFATKLTNKTTRVKYFFNGIFFISKILEILKKQKTFLPVFQKGFCCDTKSSNFRVNKFQNHNLAPLEKIQKTIFFLSLIKYTKKRYIFIEVYWQTKSINNAIMLMYIEASHLAKPNV